MNLQSVIDFFTKDKGNPSITRTLVLISFGLLVIAGGLEMFEVTKTTSVFETLYISNLGVYLGRRFEFKKGDKSTTVDPGT